MEARAGAGHGGVDVKGESIRGETMKQCVFDGEIHIWMKQTSIEIIKQIFLKFGGSEGCGMGDGQVDHNILKLDFNGNPYS